MKRVFLVLMIGVALVMTGSAYALDFSNNVSAGGRFGGILPLNGAYDTQDDLKDIVDLGPYFGLDLGYTVVKEVTVRAGFNYSWMKVKEEKRAPNLEPVLNFPSAYLKGVFNFGSIMPVDSKINPFASLGLGFYPWKITDDGLTGDAIVLPNGEEFKKSSLGINFGAGLEGFPVSSAPELAFYGGLDYHFVFMKDEDKFGNDFENQGFFTFGAGIRYYFPVSK